MKNRGFTLLEILIAVAIVGIVASMAIPNTTTLIQYSLRHEALLQMRTVRNAEAQLAICNAQSLPCPGVAAQIPAPGSLTTAGYVYVFAQSGGNWSYTASPLAQPNTSYYSDQSGQIHYRDDGSTATAAAPLIQ
jgi:prepilin-type N-terminal cleavage/methylation domain-containing protein